MVATRSLFTATFLLLASMAVATPAASKTSSVVSYSTKISSKSTTTKSTPTKSTTTTKKTTKKTSSKSSTTSATASPTPTCEPEYQGIIYPANGAIITQIDDGSYDNPTYFEVIYCSGAYFKTSSLDGSLLLGGPPNGQLLIKDQKPDNLDTGAGFYSYRFNASIYPLDGNYYNGQYSLNVYETINGYYVDYNYAISSINITFAVKKAS